MVSSTTFLEPPLNIVLETIFSTLNGLEKSSDFSEKSGKFLAENLFYQLAWEESLSKKDF